MCVRTGNQRNIEIRVQVSASCDIIRKDIEQNMDDADELMAEPVSSEEYMQRVRDKYRLLKDGKLTIDDFHGFEVFLLTDLLKADAEAAYELMTEAVRQANIERYRKARGSI